MNMSRKKFNYNINIIFKCNRNITDSFIYMHYTDNGPNGLKQIITTMVQKNIWYYL